MVPGNNEGDALKQLGERCCGKKRIKVKMAAEDSVKDGRRRRGMNLSSAKKTGRHLQSNRYKTFWWGGLTPGARGELGKPKGATTPDPGWRASVNIIRG